MDRSWVERVARLIDIPFCVAGASAASTMHATCCMPARKMISVNTPALDRPDLIGELADAFGVQCVVVGIDSLRDDDGEWRVRHYTAIRRVLARWRGARSTGSARATAAAPARSS